MPDVPNNTSRAHDKKTPFEAWEVQVVLLDMTGFFTAEDLAERFKKSVVTIQRRLRDPQAETIRAEARQKIKEKTEQEVIDEIPNLVKLAVKALKRTLEADITAVHKAKANQDKVALAVLTGSGLLKPETADEDKQGGLRMSPEQHKDIIAALEKSAKVRELHAIPMQELVTATETNGNGQASDRNGR